MTADTADERAAGVLPAALQGRLRTAYEQPPRHHHTHAHAAFVARTAVQLGGGRACVIAAWFHDAVYDPRRGDNEVRSALLLRDWLPDDPDVDEAARLVELTATHSPAKDDVAGAVLCDADLAVLGASPPTYEAYRAAVRLEYGHVPDEGWRAGRTTILRGLLDRQPLFRTTVGHRLFEDRARANMTAELADLDR